MKPTTKGNSSPLPNVNKSTNSRVEPQRVLVTTKNTMPAGVFSLGLICLLFLVLDKLLMSAVTLICHIKATIDGLKFVVFELAYAEPNTTKWDNAVFALVVSVRTWLYNGTILWIGYRWIIAPFLVNSRVDFNKHLSEYREFLHNKKQSAKYETEILKKEED